MEGRDVVGQSQTGSGKTAAFAIPAVEKVNPQDKAVQALILCPTRELAVQVSEEVHKLALFKRGIHALPIYGGQSYERQFFGLKQGSANCDWDARAGDGSHAARTLRLDRVKMLILDEADVMLDMGFREDIEFILEAVPAERQTVFFSATLPPPIQQWIKKFARDPQRVSIEQKALTVPTVEQVYYEVDRRFKIELLTRLIDIHDLKLGIVFCNTKRMVDDLVDHLNAQGYSADRLHGDMSQGMRDRVMNKFRKSGLEFLVATDVAARGIDVDDVQVVFNYDLPYDVEDYLHRIGRTGRAGRSGRAISFVAGREVFQIYNIERYTKTKIQRAKPPTAGEVEEARVSAMLDKLRATLQSGEFKRQDHLIERLLEEGFTSTDVASALLHHLQSGDGPSAQKPRVEEREERSERPERGSFREERGYREDRPRRSREEERPRFERPSFRANEGQARLKVSSTPAPRSAPAVVQPKAEPAPAESKPERAEPVASTKREVDSKSKPPGDVIEEKSELLKPIVPKRGPFSPPVFSEADSKPAPVRPIDRPVRHEQTPRPGRFGERRERVETPLGASPKHSRRTPGDQTRLYLSVGSEMGVSTGDVVGAILGETGLPANTVGTVDLRERHAFVDVAAPSANSIIAKLNRATIKGHKLKVKLA